MVVASLIISIVGAVVGVLALTLNYANSRKARMLVHFTWIKFEEDKKAYCDLIFANNSLEPYAITKIIFVMDNNKEVVPFTKLCKHNLSTFVAPRQMLVLYKISLENRQKYYDNAKDKFAYVYTTKREKPYKILLNQNSTDTILE